MVVPAAVRSTVVALLRRKLILALVVGAASFASVYAFAASLNVSSQSLGAGNSVVASCAPSTGASAVTLTASYSTTYDSSFGGYKVSKVTLNATLTSSGAATAIPVGCAGKLVTVDLAAAGPAYTSLGEATATIPASPPNPAPGSTFDIPMPANGTGTAVASGGTGVFPVKAQDVGNVSVVIAG
jgi:hypothetical protein